MPKTFEELMEAARKLQTTPSSTGPNFVTGAINPGWRKADEPPPFKQYLAFKVNGPMKETEDILHLFRPGWRKEEILEVEDRFFASLDVDIHIIIHGHSALVPCATPDGCFETKGANE